MGWPGEVPVATTILCCYKCYMYSLSAAAQSASSVNSDSLGIGAIALLIGAGFIIAQVFIKPRQPQYLYAGENAKAELREIAHRGGYFTLCAALAFFIAGVSLTFAIMRMYYHIQ